MTGGQVGPTAPFEARTTTSPYGNFEYPFNLPYLVAASGGTYIARWTIIHLRQLESTISEALLKPGFKFIEVIAPCPTVYGRMNKEPHGIDSLHHYQEKSIIRHGTDPKDVDIDLNGPIIVGKFIDIVRPTLWENMQFINNKMKEKEKAKAKLK
jgi:2-oxoglutarate ferredoxin oxidoreductase subunit beta